MYLQNVGHVLAVHYTQSEQMSSSWSHLMQSHSENIHIQYKCTEGRSFLFSCFIRFPHVRWCPVRTVSSSTLTVLLLWPSELEASMYCITPQMTSSVILKRNKPSTHFLTVTPFVASVVHCVVLSQKYSCNRNLMLFYTLLPNLPPVSPPYFSEAVLWYPPFLFIWENWFKSINASHRSLHPNVWVWL